VALFRRLTEEEKEAVARVDQLPDGAAVGLRLAELYSGICRRTWSSRPPIRVFPLTPSKNGVNVGQLRKLTRGELTPDAA
jgi:hypothetical protein